MIYCILKKRVGHVDVYRVNYRCEFRDFQTIVDFKIDRPVHGHQLKHPCYLAGSLGSSISFGSYS